MAILPPLPNPPPPEEAPLVASMAPADVGVAGLDVVGSAEGITVSVVMICWVLVRVSPSVVMVSMLVKVLVLACVVVGAVDVVGGIIVLEVVGGCGCDVEVGGVDDGGCGIDEDVVGGTIEEVVEIGGCDGATEVLLMIVGPTGGPVGGSLTDAVFGSAEAPGTTVPSGPEMAVLVLLLDMLKT